MKRFKKRLIFTMITRVAGVAAARFADFALRKMGHRSGGAVVFECDFKAEGEEAPRG